MFNYFLINFIEIKIISKNYRDYENDIQLYIKHRIY